MTKLQGLERLKKRLGRMPAEAKKTIRAALEGSADVIVSTAKGFAPRGETGNLERSIRKEPGAHELAVTVKAAGG